MLGLPASLLRTVFRCCAVLVALLAVTEGAAQAQTTTLVPSGSGLTVPAGAVRDGSGTLWISDHLEGVCRVVPGQVGGPFVRDAWCGLGHAGPAEAFQLAYDPANDIIFAAEGTSQGSGVWRLRLGPAGIVSGERIADTSLNDERVFGLALGSDAGTPVLDFTSKRTPLVRRIADPATCTAPCDTVIIGSAQNPDVPSLARVGDALYLAEPTGVTKLTGDGAGQIAQPVPGLPGGVPSALVADPARNRVYAGTTNPNGRDQVDVLELIPDRIQTYASGFSGIGALAVSSDGTLTVADDPGLTGDGVVGQGRVFSVGLQALDRAFAAITDGPAAFWNSATATIAYESANGARFECRTDPVEDPPTSWAACGTGTTGQTTLNGLAEGVHVFEVRAVNASDVAGPVSRRTFVVDLTAPSVTIDAPAAGALLPPGRVSMRFSADEPMSGFSCSVDGGAAQPCSDPTVLDGLALGPHTFAVTGVDLAGNPTAAPAQSTFTVRIPEVPVRPDNSGKGSDNSGSGNADARADLATTVANSARGAGAPDLRVLGQRPLNRRRSLGALRRQRRLRMVIDAGPEAKHVVVQLFAPGGSAKPFAFATAVASGRGTVVDLKLTARQARRLHAGLYRVRVNLLSGPDVGPDLTSFLRVVRGG